MWAITVLLVLTAAQAVAGIALAITHDRLPPAAIPVVGEVLEFVGVQVPNRTVFLIAEAALVVLFTVLSVGFWRLRRWAWVGVMLTWAITLTAHVLAWLLAEGTEEWRGSSVVLALVIAQVLYLNRRDVQTLFEAQDPERPAPTLMRAGG